MRRFGFDYANVMSTIAVFIALGGTSYAAMKLPRNSVGYAQFRADAVTSSKVREQVDRARRSHRQRAGAPRTAWPVRPVRSAGPAVPSRSSSAPATRTPPDRASAPARTSRGDHRAAGRTFARDGDDGGDELLERTVARHVSLLRRHRRRAARARQGARPGTGPGATSTDLTLVEVVDTRSARWWHCRAAMTPRSPPARTRVSIAPSS